MIWEILFILVLILANGLFAAAEIAIIAARRGRLEQRAEEGSRNAQLALELSRNPDRFLPTVQIGITLVSAFGAAYGGQQIVDDLERGSRKWPCPFAQRACRGDRPDDLRRLLHLCVADPRRAGAQAGVACTGPRALAIFVAPVMHFLATVARPLVWFMGLRPTPCCGCCGCGPAPSRPCRSTTSST